MCKQDVCTTAMILRVQVDSFAWTPWWASSPRCFVMNCEKDKSIISKFAYIVNEF